MSLIALMSLLPGHAMACTTSRWDAQVGGEDMATGGLANGVKKVEGNCGLRIVINDSQPHYLRSDSPNNETRYIARFYFLPEIGSSGSFVLFSGYSNSGDREFAVVANRSSGNLRLQYFVRRDNGTQQEELGGINLTSGAWHEVTVDWSASSASGSNNGSFSLTVNGTTLSASNIDNDLARLDSVRLGIVQVTNVGLNGRLHLDEFASVRSGIIQSVAIDSDNDGTPDSTDTDDDNDGMLDTWENANGFDPLNPQDANQDADNDGFTNRQEHDAGTDPRNAASNPGTSDTDKIGVARPNNGQMRYFLDINGNFSWTPGIDQSFGSFGLSTDRLIVGDWDGNGVDEIGVARPCGNGLCYYLDINSDFSWTPGVDKILGSFGFPSDTILVGDWNGDGVDQIGVARTCGSGLCYYLDINGNFSWTPGVDRAFGRFGFPTDTLIVGDWNGDGVDQIGVARTCGSGLCYYLDINGNFSWTPGVDRAFGRFGFPTDTLIVGDWNGDGVDQIGVARTCGSGLCYYLDINGNFSWTPGVDRAFGRFGFPSDTAVIVGKW